MQWFFFISAKYQVDQICNIQWSNQLIRNYTLQFILVELLERFTRLHYCIQFLFDKRDIGFLSELMG